MPYKVAIIGGGWYGCHLGWSMHNLGFEIRIYEKSHRLLHQASGNNQFRLHLGFHYARHQRTRHQSRDGYLRFIERYPTLSSQVEDNIYAVPIGESLLDFPTYKLIMASSGINFIEFRDIPPILRNVEGAILTEERVIMLSRARQYFKERLERYVTFGHEVRSIVDLGHSVEVDGESFDFVIDATWGHFKRNSVECTYEPTLLIYYETREPCPAITFVDGPLSSVYPTEDPFIFTLSSVQHTPIARVSSAVEARKLLSGITSDVIHRKRAAMERQISQNVPSFTERFRFAGVQLSIKTKPVGRSDDRSCYVHQNGRVFSVLSGKIDTIFHATERILSAMQADLIKQHDNTTQDLRHDMIVK